MQSCRKDELDVCRSVNAQPVMHRYRYKQGQKNRTEQPTAANSTQQNSNEGPARNRSFQHISVEDAINRLCLPSASDDAQQNKKRRGRPKGSTKRKHDEEPDDGDEPGFAAESTEKHKTRGGKSKCTSVAKKLLICKEYEELKAQGIANAETHLIKSQKYTGCLYQGALSQTRWLGSRVAQKWDQFVEECPTIADKVAEVPNAMRRSMKMQAWYELIYV